MTEPASTPLTVDALESIIHELKKTMPSGDIYKVVRSGLVYTSLGFCHLDIKEASSKVSQGQCLTYSEETKLMSFGMTQITGATPLTREVDKFFHMVVEKYLPKYQLPAAANKVTSDHTGIVTNHGLHVLPMCVTGRDQQIGPVVTCTSGTLMVVYLVHSGSFKLDNGGDKTREVTQGQALIYMPSKYRSEYTLTTTSHETRVYCFFVLV